MDFTGRKFKAAIELLLFCLGFQNILQAKTTTHLYRRILQTSETQIKVADSIPAILLGSNYKLFLNTPAWELAKAVRDGDSSGIKLIIQSNKAIIDFIEPKDGQTLLKMAVMHGNYISVKTLLELGADPNKQDKSDGDSPLLSAARLGAAGNIHPYANVNILKLLLKYKGDPNARQVGDPVRGNKTHFTPLEVACLANIFDYVKILVEAGAKINSDNGSNLLYTAIVSRNPDIVSYLLEKGANFKKPLYTNSDGESKYIIGAIKAIWDFDPKSKEYEKEAKIISFLKSKNQVK